MALVLVYVAQGRAYLLVQNSPVFAWLVMGGTIQTVLYARILGVRTPSAGASADEIRLRNLSLWCGSLVVGIIAGFLLPAALENYAHQHSCELPRALQDSFQGMAAASALLFSITFLAYAIWRISFRKTAGTAGRDFGLLLVPYAAVWIGNHVWPAHRLFLFGVLMIAGCVLVSLPMVKSSKPLTVTDLRRWALLLALFWAVSGLLLAIFPKYAEALGGGATVWLVLQFWVALGVMLTLALRWCWSHHHPILFTVIAAGVTAFLVSFSGQAFHARDVRVLNDAAVSHPALEVRAQKWLAHRRAEIESTESYPVFLVASAGGGIRAAYWTAGLLSALQDADHTFAAHLFGISSVSGGSVGASVFAALVQANCSGCRERAAAILGGDFLGPTLSTMLIRDVASSALRQHWPDRGGALEQAFERSWQRVMGSAVLGQRFENLWQGADQYRVPSLFLNATEAGSAKRVVISDVSMKGVDDLDTSIQTAVERRSLRLSTAALLSARFPYVSPEARMMEGRRMLRLVDGGFFDNSGAATLAHVHRVLAQAAREAGLANKIRIVVLDIENDAPPAPGCNEQVDPGGFSTPLTILDRIRSAQAERFKQELRVIAGRESFWDDFRPGGGAAEFPLGWTLSAATRAEMDSQIEKRVKAPDGEMADVLKLLKK